MVSATIGATAACMLWFISVLDAAAQALPNAELPETKYTISELRWRILRVCHVPLPCGRGSVCSLVLSRDRQEAVWREYVSVFQK